eukprot:15717568-Heterocapsa_arctica.AAC.1
MNSSGPNCYYENNGTLHVLCGNPRNARGCRAACSRGGMTPAMYMQPQVSCGLPQPRQGVMSAAFAAGM